MHSDICRAIGSRFLLAFIYDGHRRIVEPYCYGLGSERRELLRAFQIAGTSSRGALGWKLFDVSKIAALTIHEEQFVLRPDYNRADSAIDLIHCCV